jgi:diacylglycerol kinase (ATP)
MGQSTLGNSFVAAFWGLLNTVATQRNMKIHVISAVMVMVVGMALPLGLASRAALLFCVALVLFAEILNTALEAFVDLHIQDFAKLAMIAKDAAAAGVLILSIGTVLILGDILWTQWHVVSGNPESVLNSVTFGVPLSFVVALILFGPRKIWFRIVFGLIAVALAVPLWLKSTDPAFSTGLGGLLLLAVFARPRLVGKLP